MIKLHIAPRPLSANRKHWLGGKSSLTQSQNYTLLGEMKIIIIIIDTKCAKIILSQYHYISAQFLQDIFQTLITDSHNDNHSNVLLILANDI